MGDLSRTALDEAYAYCEAQVKVGDRVAWLASLFAPADRRPALHALAAFALDASSVRAKVREPLAGELRLQWWTDAIEGEARGDVRGHPVAAALLDMVRRFHVSRPALTGFLDAKRVDLYGEAIETSAAFQARADATEGALIAAAAQVLADRVTPVVAAAALHAGRAVAVVKSLRDLAIESAPVSVPLDLLGAAGVSLGDLRAKSVSPAVRKALAGFCRQGGDESAALRAMRAAVDPAAAPAFLAPSLAGPALRGLAKPGRDPFEPPPELPQWRTQWQLWRAARRNGVL